MVQFSLPTGERALIDEADADRVLAYRWHRHCTHGLIYVYRSLVTPDRLKTTQFLHTFLTGWGQVDHINGNGLDNRRDNLRRVTHAQNQRNRRSCRGSTSMYKGVSWQAKQRKWQAGIWLAGRQRHLGAFDSETDAALSYDAAARTHFGQFAALNFPRLDEQSALRDEPRPPDGSPVLPAGC